MTTSAPPRPREAGPPTSVLLCRAAEAAAAQRTVSAAVRAAWDRLVQDPAALAAWARSHGWQGPVEGLFGEACASAGSPAGVAETLRLAAAGKPVRADEAAAPPPMAGQAPAAAKRRRRVRRGGAR
jgi:hypothetical protein